MKGYNDPMSRCRDRPARSLEAALLLFLLLVDAASLGAAGVWDTPLPFAKAGLDERLAALHLLRRFTFGPRPDDIERVVESGLRGWVEGQLSDDLPGARAAAQLARLTALNLDASEIRRFYSYPYELLERAFQAGAVTREAYSGRLGDEAKRDALATIERLAADLGYQPEAELLAQLRAQKLYRALFSESQLVEVLTDFWANHFNVAVSHPQARGHLLAFERDAIRPHVLGSFRHLLGAVTRHPAMLLYLGNARSTAVDGVSTTFDLKMKGFDRFAPSEDPVLRLRIARALGWRDSSLPRTPSSDRGLNENHARELLELHTLGVDSGYSQDDVIAVARALTGWTTFPDGMHRERLERLVDDALDAGELGFVRDGEFLFRPDLHDSEVKTVLGTTLSAGRGIEDGEEVLDLLALHPATARHIVRKLAMRFVSDHPPRALVERLAETFELTRGDLREVMRKLVESPEFWSLGAREGKLKTPFELTVSALRTLDAQVFDVERLVHWLTRMGQPLYGHAAPTGYPENSIAWAEVGPLLARLNFAIDLAQGRVDGVDFELLARVDEDHLVSRADALTAFLPLLLPGEKSSASWRRILHDEREKKEEAAEATPAPPTVTYPATTSTVPTSAEKRRELLQQNAAYAVGLILAAPEFQRR